MRFPIEPLLDQLSNGRPAHTADCPCVQGGHHPRSPGYCITYAEFAELIGVNEKTLSRARAAGLSLGQADWWACSAGYATVTIWPEWAAEADRVYGVDQEEAA